MTLTAPRKAAIPVLAVALACSAPRPPPCPGEPVALLHFQGTRVGGDSCPSIGAATLSFAGTLAWDGDTGALLCPEQAEAQPLRGTRLGDHVVVSSPATAANAPSCTCAVDVTETLEGDLLQPDGGVSFTGELRNAMAAAPGADPASCEPASSPSTSPACGVPCEIRWQVSGAR